MPVIGFLNSASAEGSRAWADAFKAGLAEMGYWQDRNVAVEWVRRAIGRNNAARFNLRTLIATLVALGRDDEAAAAAHHLLRVQPDFRLSSYARRGPFRGVVLHTWIDRLKSAGVPD